MNRKQIVSVACLTASVFCALAVVPALAQTNELSLGEVARRNRAAHAKAKPKSKVTDEDVPSRPMSTATVTNYGSSASLGSSSPDSNSNTSQSSAEATSGTKNTAEPRNTAETAQAEPGSAKSAPDAKADRVTQLKKDQESLNQILDKLRAKLAAESDETRRQTLGEVIRNTEQELEKKQQELSEAERPAPRK